MNNSPIVIGISGLKRSGKNTVGGLLMNCFSLKQYPIVQSMGFADGVKEELAAAFETTVKFIEERKVKPEMRLLLQWWGTDLRRAEDESYWIKKVAEKIDLVIDKYPLFRCVFVITDVRFPNEAEFIKSKGGYLIKVDRPSLGENTDPHPSEALVSKLDYHYRVTNNASMLRLEKEIQSLFVGFIKPHFRLN